eukprot:5415201-Prymnesium_polylepis.1
MMRPCATCARARVCCVRLGSWSVACPPFPASRCACPCALCRVSAFPVSVLNFTSHRQLCLCPRGLVLRLAVSAALPGVGPCL